MSVRKAPLRLHLGRTTIVPPEVLGLKLSVLRDAAAVRTGRIVAVDYERRTVTIDVTGFDR